MAPIQYSRIVSYSSEDSVHKVENLLKPESTKKWKCKSKGEKQATVILQLCNQVHINSLDIGNEYSAFVEVLAAKSSNPDEYKVLLPAVCMMSIQDSKQGLGINSVRFFKSESLLNADETWDLIKVVCTQPYNKCVQYGLAFITVHSAITKRKNEAPALENQKCSNEALEFSQKLGNFVLKDDPAESSTITLGNWFSKRKAISPPKEYVKVPKTSLSSSIKEDSSPHLVKADKPKKTKRKTDDFSGKIVVKVAENDGSARRATHGPLLYVPDEEENCKDVETNDRKEKPKDSKTSESQKKKDMNGKKDTKKVDTKDSKRPEKNDGVDKTNSNSQKRKDFKESKNSSNLNKDKTTLGTACSSKNQKKPFNRLLEGVTFVISGFENPLRGDLRNQALEMGAVYKTNWDQTCTHLLCAFPNTPKCRSVQGLNGKIVTKDWIADCYNQCKRLPWRRYALLRSDQAHSESEEEVEEEKPAPSTPQVILSSTKHDTFQSQPSSSSNNTSHTTSNNQSQASSTVSSSHSSSLPHELSDDDTDIDESADFSGKLSSRTFDNIFQDLSFLVHVSIEDSLRDKLFRYITTYGGYCSCEGIHKHTPIRKLNSNEHWDYIFAENLNHDEKAKYSNTKWIRSDWIWECVNQNTLVSSQEYIIKI